MKKIIYNVKSKTHKNIAGKYLIIISPFLISLLLTAGCTTFPVSLPQYIQSEEEKASGKKPAEILWDHNTFSAAYNAFSIDGVKMNRVGQGMFNHKIYVAEGSHKYKEARMVCIKTIWVDTGKVVNHYGSIYSVVEPGWFISRGNADVEGTFEVKADTKYNWFKMDKTIDKCNCRSSGYEYKKQPHPIAKFIPMEQYGYRALTGFSQTSIEVFPKPSNFREKELVELTTRDDLVPREIIFKTVSLYMFDY